MRYKIKTKDCRLLIRAKASFGENINEEALSAFARSYLRGFLKPKMVKRNVVEYSGPVGISLYERLKRPVTRRDFLFILEQIVVAAQKIRSNRLQLDHVVLDLKYVFINDVTKEIQFLYVPSSRGEQNGGMKAFLESVIYSIVPAGDKDADVVSRFVYFLKGQNIFNPEATEAFISREDRSVVNIIRKQHAGQSGFITDKKQQYYDHYNGSQSAGAGDNTVLLDEENTGLLEDEENTGLLSEDTGLLEDTEGTGLLLDGDEGTALLVEDIPITYPTLHRVLTGEDISINKPVFRVGKERSYVDYFVSNNNAVSRSHADIITRGSTYYVIDLNSKNHTFINNVAIPVQAETEIRNGDYLKLGNEEFIFHV